MRGLYVRRAWRQSTTISPACEVKGKCLSSPPPWAEVLIKAPAKKKNSNKALIIYCLLQPLQSLLKTYRGGQLVMRLQTLQT